MLRRAVLWWPRSDRGQGQEGGERSYTKCSSAGLYSAWKIRCASKASSSMGTAWVVFPGTGALIRRREYGSGLGNPVSQGFKQLIRGSSGMTGLLMGLYLHLLNLCFKTELQQQSRGVGFGIACWVSWRLSNKPLETERAGMGHPEDVLPQTPSTLALPWL